MVEEVFIDSTHVIASANKKKYTKEIVEKEARTYQEKLEGEINKDREAHGEKLLKKIKTIKTKEVKVSKTDPDSGMLNKNEKEKCFAYLRHTPYCKEVYERRKETIERVFADLKEKHGLRWTTLRGKEKLSMQAMLVFAAMNLKKMATWLWRKGKGPFDISKLYPLFGVLKKILSRYIQPLLSQLGKQGLKFRFVNKLLV